MLSPLSKSAEKPQKRTLDLPLPPKEKEVIGRLASEQAKKLERSKCFTSIF